MGELATKVDRALRMAFPDLKSLEINDEDGIIGVLVSPSFEGLEAIDRQDRIWDVLDRALASLTKSGRFRSSWLPLLRNTWGTLRPHKAAHERV